MEIHLVSFASRCFYTSQQTLEKSAADSGIKNIRSWKYRELIFTSFFWKNLRVLRSKRGAGYWAWQPFIINKSLQSVKEGDVVIFCDAGLKFTAPISKLNDILLQNDVLVFSAGNHINSTYTKRDAFILMGCDEERYWNGPQVLGGFHIWKKNERSLKVLADYYKYCTDHQVVSDSKNRLGDDLPDFVDHRHPQSILSLLALKHGLKIFTCPLMSTNEFNEQQLKFDPAMITGIDLEQPLLLAHRTRRYTFIDKLLLKTGLWI